MGRARDRGHPIAAALTDVPNGRRRRDTSCTSREGRPVVRRSSVAVWTIALLAVMVPSGTALTSPDCGDVVEESVKLDNSLLNCPHHGLVIGAGAITIDLNGHTIDAASDGAGAGIFNDDGHKDVVITDGRITDFDKGVLIDASSQTRNEIDHLVLSGNTIAISIDRAEKNVIDHNELDGNDDGIRIAGDGNVVESNEIFDESAAIDI